MKHLQKFYKKGVKVLVIILIGFLSGALGSFVTLQLYQNKEIKLRIIILALSLKHPIKMKFNHSSSK
mgnify:CR=1 FL=1